MEAGRIGPNAILQLVDVLERRGEFDLCRSVLAEAGVERPSSDAGMLPEADCAAVHQALRRLTPAARVCWRRRGWRRGITSSPTGFRSWRRGCCGCCRGLWRRRC